MQLRTSRLNAKVAGPAREWQQKHSKMLGSAARGPEKRMAGVSTFQLKESWDIVTGIIDTATILRSTSNLPGKALITLPN